MGGASFWFTSAKVCGPVAPWGRLLQSQPRRMSSRASSQERSMPSRGLDAHPLFWSLFTRDATVGGVSGTGYGVTFTAVPARFPVDARL
jgi:hypothetical protein